jgi:hypothetical protein
MYYVSVSNKEEQDLLHHTLPGYILGLSFCHQNLQKESVCIFVNKDQYFRKFNISHNHESIWKHVPLN